MLICSGQQVEQIYGANVIFRNLSFEIKQGERMVLIRRNGEGKTTLLKLIAGETKPNQGIITWKKGLSIGWLDQIPNVDEEKRVIDCLLDVFGDLLKVQHEMKKVEQSLAEDSGADLDRLLHRYGELQEQFFQKNGYEVDAKIRKIASGKERSLPFLMIAILLIDYSQSHIG
jgi:ATPase subunit of ABC transporter with duplicated ATPase domains